MRIVWEMKTADDASQQPASNKRDDRADAPCDRPLAIASSFGIELYSGSRRSDVLHLQLVVYAHTMPSLSGDGK